MTAATKRPKLSRLVFIAAALLLVVAGSLAAFWPRPTLVDLASVTRGALQVSIDEEARALVRQPYLVAAPSAGRLERVQLEVGDRVEAGKTVLARLRPSLPTALDERAREQAQAVIQASAAVLEVAKVEQGSAQTQLAQAEADLARMSSLFDRGLLSLSEFERFQQAQRAAQSRLDASLAAIALREAQLAQAKASAMQTHSPQKEGPQKEAPQTEGPEVGANETALTLLAPIDGQVLRVLHRSETPIQAGAAIMELGDIARDLMVEAELVSSDAVRIRVGNPVALEAWGGKATLSGEVTRIAPIAVTKVSALGVEEQRVRVEIALTSPPEARAGLGHGYRLKARIITWQTDEALVVPAAALFRDGEAWSVFAVETTQARGWQAHLLPQQRLVKRRVVVEANNGLQAAVASGLQTGEQVVLYPDKGLQEGQAVADRLAGL